MMQSSGMKMWVYLINDELISSISSTKSASPTNVRIKAREMSASSVRSFLLCTGILN